MVLPNKTAPKRLGALYPGRRNRSLPNRAPAAAWTCNRTTLSSLLPSESLRASRTNTNQGNLESAWGLSGTGTVPFWFTGGATTRRDTALRNLHNHSSCRIHPWKHELKLVSPGNQSLDHCRLASSLLHLRHIIILCAYCPPSDDYIVTIASVHNSLPPCRIRLTLTKRSFGSHTHHPHPSTQTIARLRRRLRLVHTQRNTKVHTTRKLAFWFPTRVHFLPNIVPRRRKLPSILHASNV